MKTTTRLFSLLAVLLLALGVLKISPVQAAGMTRYVKPSATGAGDCSSWDNACTLATALINSISGDEIWVATGIHIPVTADPGLRNATFQLKNGVAVYGGFAGIETSRDQRNPAANVTILSGDIDNNDSQTPVITNLTAVTGNDTNSYRVVTGATGATLDGFTITAGYGDVFGGGMYNSSASPTLASIIFSGNYASDSGGGMYNTAGSSPNLTNVTFTVNSATNSGGGMRNYSSHPTLTDVTFNQNSANNGGGMFNDISSPVLTTVTFSQNLAGWGGGM